MLYKYQLINFTPTSGFDIHILVMFLWSLVMNSFGRKILDY